MIWIPLRILNDIGFMQVRMTPLHDFAYWKPLFMIEEKQEMKHMADIEGDIPKNWPLTIIEQPPHSPSLNSSLEIDPGECFFSCQLFCAHPSLDAVLLTHPDTSLLDMNLGGLRVLWGTKRLVYYPRNQGIIQRSNAEFSLFPTKFDGAFSHSKW